MTKTFLLIAVSIYSLILLPTLVQPIGSDYSIFLLGGKNILNGGKPFVDFIDIKPIGVYYFFSLIFATFGSNPFYHQLFFALLNIFSALIVVQLFLDNKFTPIESLIAPIPMLLTISTYDFNNRMQLENLFIFFILIIIFLLFRKHFRDSYSKPFRNELYCIIIGFLAGFLTFLKYTFGFSIFLAIAYLFQEQASDKLKRKYIGLVLLSFLVAVFIFILPILIDENSKLGFIAVQKYLSYYFTIQLQTNGNCFEYTIKNFVNFWAENFSVLFTVLAFYGYWQIFTKAGTSIRDSNLIRLINLGLFLGIFSIFIENKLFNYHFLRILPFLSPFVSLGAIEIYNTIKNMNLSARRKTVAIFILTIILLSPMPKYTYRSLPFFYFFLDKSKYQSFYEKDLPTYHLQQQTEISKFLNPKLQAKDTILCVSISSAQIYLNLRTNIVPRFPLSCFYLSTFTLPQNWKRWLNEDFIHYQYIIFQNDDRNWIFGHTKSSLEAFMENPKLKTILDNKFKKIFSTKNYEIYGSK